MGSPRSVPGALLPLPPALHRLAAVLRNPNRAPPVSARLVVPSSSPPAEVGSCLLRLQILCCPDVEAAAGRRDVDDAPALERLLVHNINRGPSINVIHAPRLQMLGYLGVGITELQLGSTLFRPMCVVRLAAEFRCVRMLAMCKADPQLKPVADFLRCFPCLETLYITSHMVVPKSMKILNYEMDDPIECLSYNLNTVVLKGYRGRKHELQLAMFLVRSARVLRFMKFLCENECNPSWLAKQKRRLLLDNRASLGAQFLFQKFTKSYIRFIKEASNISLVDPFDT